MKLGASVLSMLALAVSTALPAVAACSGADPGITIARVASVQTAGGLSHYHLSITVVNHGTQGQASNVLDSVQMYQDGIKVDEKGLPPLKAGASYTFTHDYVRASDAGKGTTVYRFQLVMHKPSGMGPANCSASNDRYVLTF